jgi:hypothetical protein
MMARGREEPPELPPPGEFAVAAYEQSRRCFSSFFLAKQKGSIGSLSVRF